MKQFTFACNLKDYNLTQQAWSEVFHIHKSSKCLKLKQTTLVTQILEALTFHIQDVNMQVEKKKKKRVSK